ncbi:MAG: hypothetical protein M3457_02690 [Chloroflexota bacterium]|nr:hypothetical protein [Chloroflexota bacterium]
MQRGSLLSAAQRARCETIAAATGLAREDVIAETDRIARAAQGMTDRQREAWGVRDLMASTGMTEAEARKSLHASIQETIKQVANA